MAERHKVLKPETFQILNLIGTWLAGIGALSASIVSLYLAKRESSIKVKVTAGHRLIINPLCKNGMDFCCIRVTNVGFKTVTITGIGWKSGLFKKKFGEQIVTGHALSSKLPIKLEYGDEAVYYADFYVDDKYPEWVKDFSKIFLCPYPKILAMTLRVQVFTSVRKVFEGRVEKGLRQRLISAVLNGCN